MIRSAIVLLWIALIGCALYWPTWEIVRYDEKTLNIFAWGDILEPDVISAFEKETGIKVNLSHYFSNEELIVKLKATGGVGYDLIIPSDYAVTILKNSSLIKEIDKDKFSYWAAINPSLRGLCYDTDNSYSIPWEWELYGFGIDKEYFKDPFEPSWKMLFDPSSVHYNITMVNDSIEAVDFASYYLYGLDPNITDERIEEIKNVLVRQRDWVTAYANFRGDYFLATRTCPLIIASSSYIWRTMRQFDFVSYVVPKEGSFITVENFCIPKATQKEDLVYRFLNYVYSPQSVASHYISYGYFPSTLHALTLLELDPQAEKLIRSSPAEFQKFHFLQRNIPQEKVRDIWVTVKR
ncbi:MAG TPA: spermidine/putrescine ABC transporter substrate-binding protein [Rhabdochlamydiaceae bacterium]